MSTILPDNYQTCTQLAAELQLHDSRIRQIARALGVGTMLFGVRLLTPEDCDAIRATRRIDTRPDARARQIRQSGKRRVARNYRRR
jgi:hypothetical protein